MDKEEIMSQVVLANLMHDMKDNKVVLGEFDWTNSSHRCVAEFSKILQTLTGCEVYVEMKWWKYLRFKHKFKGTFDTIKLARGRVKKQEERHPILQKILKNFMD